MNKLGNLLLKEQEELKYQIAQSRKQKRLKDSALSFVNTSKSSSLFSKAQIIREASHQDLPLRLKVETLHLPPPKPPLKKLPKRFHLSKPDITVNNDEKKRQILNQAHFLCSMMQDSQSETGKIVQNFLNGHLAKNSYESIIQMEHSAQALQNSAKEMSKTLQYEGEERELQNLRDKFIDQIRLSKFRPKGKSTVILKRNYGQKYEMLIDQVAHKTKKTEEGQDFDIFIPKSEMDYFINMMQERIDKRMKEQKEELLKDEQKLVTGLVNNVKQFKEDLREVNYTMNHLRIRSRKQANTKQTTTLRTSASLQQGETRLNHRNQKRMDDEQKADLKMRVIKALRNFIDKLKHFNITIQDVLENQIFPSCPYERANSEEFFFQVKADNIDEVQGMLIECRFHVYDIDNQLKTPLHHAAANASMEMVKLLVDSGSDLDARDMMGRTPLHMAAKNNTVDVVRQLLVYGANPSIKTIAGKRASEMSDMPVVQALINNARKLHFMMDLQPYKKRKAFWVEKAVQYFSDTDPEKIIKLQLYKCQAKLFL